MHRDRIQSKTLLRLESDRMFGVDFLVAKDRSRPAGPAAAAAASPSGEEWVRLRAEVEACSSCALAKERKKAVFGDGDQGASIMFVGEGPGADEDEQGLPFVGKAGQLLTRIIGAMGLDRRQVYITNVVKCRPPGNRTPDPVEIAACRRFLDRQIGLVSPRVIVALGAPAARTLLHSDEGITSLRGRIRRIGNIAIMPTYHPAYLLRSPERKGEAWIDMKNVLRELGLPVPASGGAGACGKG